MERTIYQEKRGLLKRNMSLDPFINAVMPILRGYGLTGEWRETYRYQDHDGNVSSREMILGDGQNAHLKHSIGIMSNPDPYSGDGGYENFKSYQLIHPSTGGKLDVFVEINRLIFTYDEIEIRFEGEADEVENLEKAVQSALQNCFD